MDEKPTIPPRIYPSMPSHQPPMTSSNVALLPPAPPTYAQATGATPTQTNTPQVVVVTPSAPVIFGPRPVDLQCPYCRNYTRTRLRSMPSSRTHIIALLLCLFQMYCCVCLPYCIDNCMDTVHYCGLCDRHLGTYMRE